MQPIEKRFEEAIQQRTCSADWNCEISRCVMRSVSRRNNIRASVLALVITVGLPLGLALSGQGDRVADVVAETVFRETQNPLRSMREPVVSDEMDTLIQVALRQ